VAVLAFAGTLLLLGAAPAWAHPYLVQTLPGPGAIVAQPPPAIEIGFTERLVLEGSSLQLLDPDGQPVALGPLHKPKTGPGLAADVKGELHSAVYRVKWAVLGDDGHSSSGDFRFGLAAPDGKAPPGAEQLSVTGGPGSQSQAYESPLRVALRWAGLLGASLLLGGAVLISRLRDRLDPDTDAAVSGRWRTLSRVGWLLIAAGAIAAVLAAAGAGAGAARVAIIFATSTGTLALAQLGAVVVAAVPALVQRATPNRDNLLGMAGAIYLGAEAAGGHVTALTTWRIPAGLAQAAHLAAGAVWVGGLVTLAFAVFGVPVGKRSAAWRVAASAFGPVATVSAAVVVITGTVAAVREVDHLYFLRWSTYGRFLLLKLVLVAAMLVLGGVVGRSLKGRRAAGGSSPAERLLRPEAVLGVAVLVLAATLAGSAQGRGQPLPAQRESVLSGPAFANAVVADGLARVVLSPATPGANRLMVIMNSDTAGSGDETARAGQIRSVEATLSCVCARQPVEALLVKRAGAWEAELKLPAEGIWRASVAVDGEAGLAPVALRVADDGFPGAPPVVIAAPADLSGRDARRCRSYQLGMLLSMAFLNADGGVDGRKVVIASADDGGDPGRARQLAEQQRRRGVDLAAPCGPGGGSAAEAFGPEVPVVLGDANAAVVKGPRVFRLAADPQAEGWAMGRAVARSAFTNRPDTPHRISVLVDEGDPTTDRAVVGLKAALALDPKAAEAVEHLPSSNASDVEVDVLRRSAGAPLLPLVRAALDPRRYAAAFLRADPNDLGAALDQLTSEELAGPAAVFVGTRDFDETFYRASKIGRRGDIVVLGEVAPDSGDSFGYTGLLQGLFPGEQATIDGLRGYLTGRAIAKVLKKGAGSAGLAHRLQLLGFFSDALASGWSPAAPDAGSWRFFAYKGSFIPSGLQPGEKPNPGRFFAGGGAWSRVATANIGLCGPQTGFDGPPPPCTPRPEPKPGTTGQK